jgi:RNA polymerase sigma factor (sigma-70 family)
MSATDRDFDDRAAVLGGLAYRVAFRILGDREESRDVAQESLARAFSRWSRIGDYDEAWISRVATNLSLDATRSRSRRRRADPVGRDGGATVDPAVTVDQRRELVAALNRLSRRQREVVAMRYLADLPEAEVAAALGCSVGTVKQHGARGLAALRRTLEAVAPDRPAPLVSPLPPEGARDG